MNLPEGMNMIFSDGCSTVPHWFVLVTGGVMNRVTSCPSQAFAFVLLMITLAGCNSFNVGHNVSAPAITSFTASPAAVTAGASVSLTGVFSNGTGMVTPGNLAVTSGTAVSVNPASTTTYTLTVTPTSGSAVTRSLTVTVTPAVASPNISSFTATPASIASGASSSLTAVFTGGTGMITPGNLAVTSGAVVTVSPSSTTTYTLTVTPSSGSGVSQTVTVTVTPKVISPSISSFTATPASITAGASSSLTAVFTGGTGVITPGNLAITSNASVSVSPTSTTTYTLTVTPASGSAITQTVTVTVTASSGAKITDKLGKPNRVLIGLGTLDESNGYAADLQAQGVPSSIVHNPDIVDQYIVGFGSGSWPYWNGNGDGSYVNIISQDADAVGAVPMITLYQMAQNGDGNISWINQSSQMDVYWANVRLMFKRIAIFGKPTLVNLEPDFWGYVELKVLNTGNDPAALAASVNNQPECSSLPNNVTGLAACILAMGREYAPNALIGFQPSFFGEDSQTLAAFMNKLGAQNADFTVAETYDRDAGCYEEALSHPAISTNINAASVCSGRGSGPFYYDESNKTSPNFTEEISNWSTYRNDLGGKLPLIWWQTPLGVPSSTPGGTDGHYRDNHVDYMLKNTAQYANIGTFGIVFSGGASYQTSISTDGGEFATLFDQYLNAGGVAPIY
jgi:hypothetical protein